MDWIFNHPQVLILLGAAVVYWINQWKKAREEEKEAQTRAQTVKPAASLSPVQTAEAERVRRIQAEIRRKIQERASGRPPALPPEPAPALLKPEDLVAELEQEDSTEPEEGVDAGVLQRQQELAAKMRELEEVRRQAGQRRAERFAEATTASLEETASRGSLLADLRDTDSVRRAIVLREVLGTPVGLR